MLKGLLLRLSWRRDVRPDLITRPGASAHETGRVWRGISRGWRGRCPECGDGRLFARYLRVAPRCPNCNADNDRFPADDAPPYLTILLIGHILVPSAYVVGRLWPIADWIAMSVWGVAGVLGTLILLPRVKGAVIGVEWATGIVRGAVSDIDG